MKEGNVWVQRTGGVAGRMGSQTTEYCDRQARRRHRAAAYLSEDRGRVRRHLIFRQSNDFAFKVGNVGAVDGSLSEVQVYAYTHTCLCFAIKDLQLVFTVDLRRHYISRYESEHHLVMQDIDLFARHEIPGSAEHGAPYVMQTCMFNTPNAFHIDIL
ncbi:hypothetical protein BKA93DRAFT_59261 [Sparassis latifolia]